MKMFKVPKIDSGFYAYRGANKLENGEEIKWWRLRVDKEIDLRYYDKKRE
jgi:hypothetical protein